MDPASQIPDDWPCLMVIRYPAALAQRARNSLSKNFPIHNIYEGNIAGVGDKVDVLEGPWPREASVAVLYFDSKRAAQMWYDCTPDIKQFDWLNGVDMIVAPLREKTGSSGNTFMEILDLEFKDKDKFYDDYVPQCAKYMKGKPGDIAVVSTDTIMKLRGMWDPSFIVINQFKSSDDFANAYSSEEYGPIKQMRQECTDAIVIVSQLTSLFRNK